VLTPIKSSANSVDVNELLKKIAKETQVPKGGRRKSKSHLMISCRLYKWDERLTKQDYETRVEEAISKLTPLMQVFKVCF